MKSITTMTLVFLAWHAGAQTILTNANEATIGSIFNYEFADTTNVNPGSAGFSQTWDFSNVTSSGQSQTDEWVDPASTPYAGSYPGTDIVQVTTNTVSGSVYLYHSLSSASTQLHGIAYSAGTSTSVMVYSDTEMIRSYPMNPGASYSDTYSGLSTMTIGPVTTNTYRSGSYTLTYDGFGTLITPAGTYPNTARLKVQQQFTDSTVYVGVPLPGTIVQNYSTSYFWGSTDAGDQLYQFYIGYDTTITSGSTTNFKSVSYLSSFSGVTENFSGNNNQMMLYPNPAGDVIYLKLKNLPASSAELKIFDMHGAVVKQKELSINNTSLLTIDQQIAGLRAGTYLARVTSGDQVWKKIFIRK